MDGRDIVCAMPTGGGKSLTYQLPALLNPGVTVVISSLTALIEHQVMKLRSRDVEAVMLLSTTKSKEKNQINERLLEMSRGQVAGDREIKFCYVTPEEIVKDNGFLSILHDLHLKGKLTRIVLDEADCVSSYGQGFRPDYRKMHILKNSFPGVPVMALSATCRPKVLEDIAKVLHLPPIVQGENANNEGTVCFAVQGARCSEAGPLAVLKEEDIDEGGSSNMYEDIEMEMEAAGYQTYDEDFENFLAEPQPSS